MFPGSIANQKLYFRYGAWGRRSPPEADNFKIHLAETLVLWCNFCKQSKNSEASVSSYGPECN